MYEIIVHYGSIYILGVATGTGLLLIFAGLMYLSHWATGKIIKYFGYWGLMMHALSVAASERRFKAKLKKMK